MRIARATAWEGSSDGPERDAAVPRSPDIDAVADGDRRYLLQYLLLNKYMVSRADAAEEIAARRRDVARDAVAEEDRKRVEVRLQHDHIPRLAEAGVVDYDGTSTMIALRPEAEAAVRAAL